MSERPGRGVTSTAVGPSGALAVRARLGLSGPIRANYDYGLRPRLRVEGHPPRTAPATIVPPGVTDPHVVAELIASAYPADLLLPSDLPSLAGAIPQPLRRRWVELADVAMATAQEILAWTVAPLTEPGLLARLVSGPDVDPPQAAEDYASQMSSPVRVLAADLPGLVAITHDPEPGVMGAAVRKGLGATLAALVPALVLGRDESAPAGWAAVHAGACLLGWCPLDDSGDGLVEILRNQAWRLTTVRQVSAALTSFAKRGDGSHAEWFARRIYSDQELTRAVRALLRSGRPATTLPLLLRELAAADEAAPVGERIEQAVAAL